ncbi:MAG: hypothetical protein WBA67_11120 [Jannaschia sp.]
MIWQTSAVTPVMPESRVGYSLDVVAVQLTILQMVLALVGFVIALLGLFGYKEIKNAAVARAASEAKLVVDEEIRKLEAWRETVQQGLRESPGSHSLGANSTVGAELAEGEE